MTTQTQNLDDIVQQMAATVKTEVEQLDQAIASKNAQAATFVRVSHEQASKFIADHLMAQVEAARKTMIQSYEPATLLRKHHDTPTVSRSQQNGFEVTQRQRIIGFHPLFHADPLDVLFAFSVTDEAIKKFADDCATHCGCKKGAESSTVLLAQLEKITAEICAAMNRKTDISIKFASLLNPVVEPQPTDQVVGDILMLAPKTRATVTQAG